MDDRKKLALAALLALPLATNLVAHRGAMASDHVRQPQAIHSTVGAPQYAAAVGMSGWWAFAMTVGAAVVCTPIGGVGGAACGVAAGA